MSEERPYFESPVRQMELLDEAHSWHLTPFRQYAGKKGVGVDCIHLVGKILEATGAIDPVDWTSLPRYSLDWSSHSEVPILEEALQRLGFVYQRIEPTEHLMIGDVMAFAPGKVIHHLGIFTGRNQMIHVMKGQVVAYAPIASRMLQDRYRYSMRAIERKEDA